MTVEMFRSLDIETISTCNRVCPTCLRNSHPNKEAVASFFTPNYLDIAVIEEALKQVKDMGFIGSVRLSHFNEPMMDERLPEIAALVKSYGYKAYMNSNGDYITPQLASRLDEVFEEIIVTLYMADPVKAERAIWIPTLFTKSKIQVITQSDHIPSHFSPKFDVKALAEKYIDNDCKEPATRCIINHRQQFLLCCEDVVGNFGLSTFPETSIEDYWFGPRHTEIHEMLLINGGRRKHPYCAICPKT